MIHCIKHGFAHNHFLCAMIYFYFKIQNNNNNNNYISIILLYYNMHNTYKSQGQRGTIDQEFKLVITLKIKNRNLKL